jgi:uncharacterized membrane protein (UPF0127 family)
MRSTERTRLPSRPDDKALPRFFRWIRCRCGKIFASGGGAQTPCRCDTGGASITFADDLYQAVNVSKEVVIASRVTWAGTSETRRRGLLGRETIDADEGAYIVPTQWIHMFGMQFPIDVAFLDSQGRVLHVCHALEPNRLSPIVWRAEGALELAAGTLQATRTEVGDTIDIR